MRHRVEDLEAAIDALTRTLERQIARTINDTLLRIEEAGLTGIERGRALLQLPQALADAGLSKVANQLEQVFADELRAIRAEFRNNVGKEITFTNIEANVIQQLLTSYKDGTYKTLERLGIDLQAELTRQVIIGEPRLDGSTYIEEASPRTVRNINTELNTGMLAFSRSVTVKKAEELGLQYGLYTGPEDKVTRPFCNHLLGNAQGEFSSMPSRQSHVYTLEEIKAMENGQSLDVRQFGGGWNCRHTWSFIDEVQAKRFGYPN